MEAMVDERLLTVREVAEQLRVNEDTVRRWLRRKKLRGRWMGGRRGYVVWSGEVHRFVASRPETSGQEEEEADA